jgi:hypothetical protein
MVDESRHLARTFLERYSMRQPVWNFEQEPANQPLDETSVNLRAYFDRMPDQKMQQYRREWSDEQVIEWDGNFRDDECLMITCCERDVGIREYRDVIEDSIRYRDRVRQALTDSTAPDG